MKLNRKFTRKSIRNHTIPFFYRTISYYIINHLIRKRSGKTSLIFVTRSIKNSGETSLSFAKRSMYSIKLLHKHFLPLLYQYYKIIYQHILSAHFISKFTNYIISFRF